MLLVLKPLRISFRITHQTLLAKAKTKTIREDGDKRRSSHRRG